ncbi:hypothetical protein [uncultured Arthrobacter sp.]|uniref:hypothetical protein n=1 Tax=uncultured Arthrobacter sp. TaxID=114050 RepID=UPI003217857D
MTSVTHDLLGIPGGALGTAVLVSSVLFTRFVAGMRLVAFVAGVAGMRFMAFVAGMSFGGEGCVTVVGCNQMVLGSTVTGRC